MINLAEWEIFLYWISERERIRQAKVAGRPRPWTLDPLLRDYRWCNVRRMDDKVSQWLLRAWYGQASMEGSLVAATLARLINWPDALHAISEGRFFHTAQISFAAQRLQALKDRGQKVFTGAYIVPGVPGMSKIDSVLLTCRDVEDHAEEILDDTMERTWAQLTKISGLGSFLAGQIVADLAFLNAGLSWKDRGTWAPLGPGSKRGMNRLMGRDKDKAMSQQLFDAELPQVVLEVKADLPEIWNSRGLIAMDIQNCLCEFDKYRRLTLGEGSVRAGYAGSDPLAPMTLLGRLERLGAALDANRGVR